MAFGDDHFEHILPPYLTEPSKSRLREGLLQFLPEHRGSEIDYGDFYRDYQNRYFLQSDLLREIRLPIWNDEQARFEKGYTEAIIISNTCDLSADNRRELRNKECLMAPLVRLDVCTAEFRSAGFPEQKIEAFVQSVRSQQKTNLFYLPTQFAEDTEYIALLDNLFWFPTTELNSYLEEIESSRIASLSHYGYYLFIFKLSYHLCRLPEQCDREYS